MNVTKAGLQSTPCKYHQPVHLSMDGKHRVHSDCESISKMKTVSWFVLPPVQEYYYKSKNLSYKVLPPLRSDCVNPASVATMDLIYPRPRARIFIPRELDGTLGSTLFEATHRQSNTHIFWHLDGAYVGTTQGTHRLSMTPDAGPHILTLIDEEGTVIEQEFSVVDRNQ
jgi:penicillin-binding protein 1C